MNFDYSRELRDCRECFATGVTVVTCVGEAAPHGATVNAFTAVSLDPPLVQATLDRRSRAAPYAPGAPFTVDVLARSTTRARPAGSPSPHPSSPVLSPRKGRS